MTRCRTCGNEYEDRKMIGYCDCGGKLIDERQYKLEQKDKCNHIIGMHTVTVGEKQGYSLPVFQKGNEETHKSINLKFKYCPLCGNKTKFYKEK